MDSCMAAFSICASCSSGKERDAESGLDYFGARYYGSTMGRFMSPDPTPLGIALGDPQSWNLYSYARNKPTTAVDVGGMWYTPVHKEMIDVALGGLLSAGEIAHLQGRQDVMDAHPSDMKYQSPHYMAVPGEDTGAAKARADKLIMDNIAQAIQGTSADGVMSSGALDRLGDAIHTLQDMTSPMHTTDDGTPRVWYGNFGHVGTNGVFHFMGESEPSMDWARFGWAIRVTMAAYVQADPVGAAKHGLTSANFLQDADRRVQSYIWQYAHQYADEPIQWYAARLCALGNPAACNLRFHPEDVLCVDTFCLCYCQSRFTWSLRGLKPQSDLIGPM